MTVGRAAALRRLGAAVVLGVIAAFGQAPYEFPIVLLVALTALMLLFAKTVWPRQAALVGWGFGTGYFMHSMVWIVSPFLVDAPRHGWMAPFALVFLSAGLALFWGGAFAFSRKLSANGWPLILCWPAVELLRAYVLTGFPWGMFSQSLVEVMAGQALAWVGPYALTLWLIAAAVVLGLPGQRTARTRGVQAALALVTGALLVLPPRAVIAPMTDHHVRLIQPNAAQRDKWNPDMIPVFFNRQLGFTSAGPAEGMPPPDLIIWSETAIPWSLDLAGTALEEISAAAQGVPVLMGVQRRSDTRYFNSAAVLGKRGEVQQVYDKHHLVPFGEYMPLGNLMANFGIHGLASREGNGYSAGPGAKLLDLGEIGRALPLICYEAVFAHDVAAAPERPAFLIQMTNDAWFGKGPGPLQHLAQARMRAIEQGLPMARVANTGVSAMIDPWGRITAMLPLNQAGYLDAVLPAPRRATPYSRSGDMPVALLLLLSIMLLIIRKHRRDSD